MSDIKLNVLKKTMQYSINLKIERFNENGKDYFVATSLEVSGLVAEADTIEEVLEIAADLVPMLIELEDGEKESRLTSVTIPNTKLRFALL